MPKTPSPTLDHSGSITWKVHKLPVRPIGLLLAVPCIIVTGWAATEVFSSLLIGLLASAVVCTAIGDYLFPVTYGMDQKKAWSKCLFNKQEILWENVRKVWLAEDGIKLSPLAIQSRLERFRGVFLEFGDNRDLILEAVQKFRAMSVAQDEQEVRSLAQ